MRSGWTSDSQEGSAAWAVLGAATQLTKLAINFKNSGAVGAALSLLQVEVEIGR